MKKIISAILPVAVALTFGCKKSETHHTAAGDVKVEQKGDTANIEVTTKDGKTTLTANDKGVTIPDTFPKDVPIPKDAVAKMSMSQGKTEVLTLHVSGNVADVAKDYQEKLKAEGWEIKSSMNMADTCMVQASKTGSQCAAVVAKDDDGATLQLSVSQE